MERVSWRSSASVTSCPYDPMFAMRWCLSVLGDVVFGFVGVCVHCACVGVSVLVSMHVCRRRMCVAVYGFVGLCLGCTAGSVVC